MTPSGTAQAWIRGIATTSFALALMLFLATFLTQLLRPTADSTSVVFWCGVSSLLFSIAVLGISASWLAKARGLDTADRARLWKYWLWAGPVGLWWVVWVLTDPRRKAPFFPAR